MKTLKRDYFKSEVNENGEVIIGGKYGITDSVFNWHDLQLFEDNPLAGIDEMIADLRDVRADVEEALREMNEQAASLDEAAEQYADFRQAAGY